VETGFEPYVLKRSRDGADVLFAIVLELLTHNGLPIDGRGIGAVDPSGLCCLHQQLQSLGVIFGRGRSPVSQSRGQGS